MLQYVNPLFKICYTFLRLFREIRKIQIDEAKLVCERFFAIFLSQHHIRFELTDLFSDMRREIHKTDHIYRNQLIKLRLDLGLFFLTLIGNSLAGIFVLFVYALLRLRGQKYDYFLKNANLKAKKSI